MLRTLLSLAVMAGTVAFADASTPSRKAATAPALTHTYLVFFESGKASLTPEAREILRNAASTARGMRPAQIRVMVPAGEPGLPQNRARQVKAELAHDGVAPGLIAEAGQPQDFAYADADPVIRAWLDRRAVVEVSPAPDAGGGQQARLMR